MSFMINSFVSKISVVGDGWKPITISYRTINNYLKGFYWNPKKIRQ